MSYLTRLVKYYGVTSDPLRGGWLLPDGMFLDFSEGSRFRSQDHRNIVWVSNIPEKPHEARYDVMARIAKTVGMYRWSPEGWNLEAWTIPTKEQISTIRELARYKEVDVEAHCGHREFANIARGVKL